MKFLHLSDLHIGKMVNGFPLIDDQRFILEQICELAKSNHVDAVVLAGDIYDKSAPSSEAVALFDDFLTSIAGACISCFAVPGNHDSAERVAYASSLLARQGIYIAPVFDGALSHFELQDEFGACEFWLMPFLRPADVKPHFPDQAERIGRDYTEAIKVVLGSCPIDPGKRNVLVAHQFVTSGSQSPERSDSEERIGRDYTEAIKVVLGSCPIDPGKRNVLVAHQFVTSGSQSPERSDSELVLGGIDNVDASVFEDFDYVALGHIHRPQRIGAEHIRYAGSPLKYSFSEIRYPKSAALVTITEKHHVQTKLIPLEPMRDMREVKGPLESLISCAPHNHEAQDYIHAILTDEHPPIDALSRLRSAYPNLMGIDFITPKHSGRSVDPEAMDIRAIDPFALFEAFFNQQHGSEMTENQEKLARRALENAMDNAEGMNR